MPINLNATANIKPLRPTVTTASQQLDNARELQGAFQDFVGKSFYGEMLKAMRSTVGEPAYFHGGNAENVFQQQLDHQLGDEMSKANGGELSAAMFRRQFPKEAALIADSEKQAAASLTDLHALRRR
ncbi:rod-binding protein [Lacipirellula limnantheis]|uniref:Rod binding protein n=1 Tax=Lacipirellula limnantheis TaxID=2528024 RepID=A0A517TVA6_9BACT|nr:rod-binding protein [Lacipirellula limnantheis]QDT72287.1 Rod binding protein [Lacipirellula limnantheis]